MNPNPIGIFDSGVGGLTVVSAIRKALPDEPVVYLGDTARVPYGDKSAKTVTTYSLEITQTLVARGIKTLVVACNTASALAIGSVRARFPDLPVRGVIGPGAEAAVAASKNLTIGVVGTRATITSRAYDRAIREIAPDATVHATPCPLFVPLVEEQWFESPVTRQVVAHYIDPLLDKGIDTLVLGCTHYPFLLDTIQHHVGDHVTVVDSATACARSLASLLAEHDLAAPPPTHSTPPSPTVLLTDTPDRFLDVANTFLDLGIDPATVTVIPPDQLGLAACRT